MKTIHPNQLTCCGHYHRSHEWKTRADGSEAFYCHLCRRPCYVAKKRSKNDLQSALTRAY